MRRTSAFVVCVLALSVAGSTRRSLGQQFSPTNQQVSISTLYPNWPKADPHDVQSPEDLVKAYYAILSGKPSVNHEWNRLRSLFLPEGRLLTLKTWRQNPHRIPAVFTVPQLVDLFTANLSKADYAERPVKIDERTTGSLTEVDVRTEIRIQSATRNICAHHQVHFELIKDTDRYWIAEIIEDMTADSGNEVCPAA